MLYVMFTRLDHSMIETFEKIPFPEAVALTQKLEMQCREEKIKIDSDFYLLDEDENRNQPQEEIYSGHFSFGSYFAPNLYIHIKKSFNSMRLNKEQQKAKLILMAKMEDGLKEEYKQEEKVDDSKMVNLDPSRISNLKKWQRRSLYALSGIFAVVMVALFYFLFSQIASFNHQYKALEKKNKEQEKHIEIYQDAMLGSNKELTAFLQKNESSLSQKEKEVYAKSLLEKKDFDQLVALFKSKGAAATYIFNYGQPKTLEEFSAEYPTNEAKFDIAFENKKYKEVTEIKDVMMNQTRSKKRTYALMKIGQIDEAKLELENNNDKELTEKVEKYEQLSSDIRDLDGRIESAKDKEKSRLEDEKKKKVEERGQL